jgi:iron complex outermembrane recepter protein
MGSPPLFIVTQAQPARTVNAGKRGKTMRQGLILVLASGVSAIALGLTPASAQTAPAADTDDEIVVTAQKREERLQDVPISISVQSGDQLENSGLSQFIALQARVPNLSITDTPANASLFIRGIGTSGNNLSFEQSVALFVDQVYGGRNRQFMQPFFDVERIEVLRGPQGALFGRNTSAGAISVTTRRPTREFEGTAAAEYETVRGTYAMQLAASGPVTDTLSARFAARYGRNNGWVDNIVLNRKEAVRDDVLARGSLLWEPAGGGSVFFKLEYGNFSIIGAPFEFVPGGTRPDYRVEHDDGLAPLRDRSRSMSATLEANLPLGEHTLTTIGSYSAYSYDQAFNIQARRPARLVVVNEEAFKQWSQEVRLTSPNNPRFDYIVGAYAEHSESDIRRVSLIDTPAPPGLNQDNRRNFFQASTVIAAFGQANWSPIDQIKIGAGLRWTQIRKSGNSSGFFRTFAVAPPGAFTDVPRLPISGSLTERSVEPTVTLAWQPNSNVNIYAKYAQGSKGGALIETANFPREFVLRPEKAKSYEAGAKFQFPAIGGFLNLAAFTTDYSDLQKSSLDQLTASFVVSNAAGARVRGIELDAGIRPAEGFRITLSGAYLDARYTSYPGGPCRFDNPAFANPGCTQNRTGDRLQNSPEWTGNIAFDLDRPISDTLRIAANWTTSYQSKINYQDSLSPLEEQAAFSKTDVRVGLGGADRSWELALLVRNLFDVRTSGIIFNTFPIGVGPNDRVHLPDPRRSFTIQGRVRF